jgi:hypothetical protein
MRTRFAVIAARRTGSNWLCTRLRAQPDIWCHGEVFHPDRVWVRSPDENDPFGDAYEPELRAMRAVDRDGFLNRIFELSFGRMNVGFKVFPEHGDGEALRIVDDTSVSKVILYRGNFLAVYASLLAALQTGAYSAAEMLRVERPMVAFSGEQFHQWRSGYEEFYSHIFGRLRITGQEFHLIRYEELNVSDRFVSLLEFLGANPRPMALEPLPVRGSANILSRFTNPEAAEMSLRKHDRLHWAREEDLLPGNAK